MDRAAARAAAAGRGAARGCASARWRSPRWCSLQIYLGALVAGIDAGLVYNTWPLIDGAFVPAADRLWFFTPAWRNLFENTLTVQFDHRMLAYAIWLRGDLARLRTPGACGRDAARRARRWQAR